MTLRPKQTSYRPTAVHVPEDPYVDPPAQERFAATGEGVMAHLGNALGIVGGNLDLGEPLSVEDMKAIRERLRAAVELVTTLRSRMGTAATIPTRLVRALI